MARCGRKPLAEAAVEHLSGSEHAKRRLMMILKTMRQELTIPEACEELGIGESRFHAMRKQWLQESLQLLEPRPVGRRPGGSRRLDDEDANQLECRISDLERELVVSHVRRQIGEALPHLLKPSARAKKGGRRPRRRRPAK